MATALTKKDGKLPFTVALQTPALKNLINRTISDPKRSAKFITSITSAVSCNPALQECDASTILSAALLGEGLNLSPSPQLGQFYMVPFNDNRNKRKVATFQLGYKGYIQLATRSGQYKKLNVLPIKQGELISFNPLEEEIKVQLIEDEVERENAITTGYYAMFEYINGFKKAMYWSREKMESHALKYSKGYAAKKGYTFWEKDFDAMACKTMLRQIISKWGIMSIELQTAYESEDAVIKEDGTYEYITDSEPQADNMVEAHAEETEQADFADLMEG